MNNQPDDSVEEAALFNAKVKSAKIKSAVVAAIPTLIILITFSMDPPFGKDVFANLGTFFLFMICPFTFIYRFIFYFGFGRQLIIEILKRQDLQADDLQDLNDHFCSKNNIFIDMHNIANGYGPGLSFMMPKRQQ